MLISLPLVLSAEALPGCDDLLGGLSSKEKAVLEKNSHVFRYDEEKKGPLYIPDYEKASLDSRSFSKLNPEIMVEALYKVPYPEEYSISPEGIIEHLYNLSHEVSSISGVKYYSERRHRYAVLFSDVYAVDNPENRDKIEDPVPGDPFEPDSVYLQMKENALGRGYYRLDYYTDLSTLTIRLTNESKLGFIMTVVNPEDMLISLEIIPCSDALLIYGYCGVVVQNDDFVDLMLDPYFAFYRRMTAMETWLYNSLHDTDKLPPVNDPMP